MKNVLVASISIVSLFATSASMAAVSESHNSEVQPSWICNDTALVNDNSFSLQLFAENSTTARKIEVYHSGYAGAQKIATLPICTVESPAPGVSDGATTVTCHDGAWKDSQRAVLHLGGFVPTVGIATLFGNRPANEVEVARFSCHQLRD